MTNLEQRPDASDPVGPDARRVAAGSHAASAAAQDTSKSGRPDNGCTKVSYRDRIGALLALARLDRQDKAGHDERRAYRCPKCRRWHLTSWERS